MSCTSRARPSISCRRASSRARSRTRSSPTASRTSRRYVNPGILDYRKSVSTDYTAVEWSDGGATFKDIRGREFIDCLGGFGIYMLGHRHPTVMKAVLGQLRHQALHSQELLDPMRGYLCELVAMVTPGDLQYSFLVNSGTEATEGALKFAKVYAYEKKPDHMLGVISTTRAFHGKSMGSLSVSGKREFRVPFQPLMPGSRFVPYGDADALEQELEVCDMIGFDIAAFICEPVQGEAGAIVPPDDYLPRVREICTKWDVVFIADEVQTGMGRTGKLWGVDNWDVAPDIMTMGKAFGGAVIPCGNIVVTPKVFHAMFANPYLHTTTFGGNPLATAAAIGALHATLEEDIPGQAAEKGAYLKDHVTALAADYPDLFDEVRGLGLLIGMEFVQPRDRLRDLGRSVRRRRAGRRHAEQRQDAAARAARGHHLRAARRGARAAGTRPCRGARAAKRRPAGRPLSSRNTVARDACATVAERSRE